MHMRLWGHPWEAQRRKGWDGGVISIPQNNMKNSAKTTRGNGQFGTPQPELTWKDFHNNA